MKNALRKLLVGITVLGMTLFPANISSSGVQQNVWEAHPLIHINRAASSGPVGYSPSQIRKAYGLDKITATGSGETIAIVDAYGSPTMQSDLTAFCTQYGLPQASLTIAYPSGKPTIKDGGWALETAMDVEWAHVVAPNAKILLCVAKSPTTANLVAAIDYATSHGAQVVSNSWGGSEFSGESTYDSHFQHTGVTYLASSGDNGAGVGWPAISNYVVSVGGTKLNIASDGTYQSETGWTGSGGGLSSYITMPTYQTNWSSVVSTHRGNPDISWDADPSTGVAVYSTTKYNNQSGWFEVGGTSLGSPCWAGMIAVMDQNRTTPLTSFNVMTDLYNAAGTTGSTGYTSYYNDITSGSNGTYSAKAGYDLVTGIGTPKASTLVNYMTTAK